MTAVDVNKARFQERVARINSGRQWTPDGVVPRHVPLSQLRPKKRGPGVGDILLVPVAGLLGMVAVFAARLVVFKVETMGLMPEALGQLGAKNALILSGIAIFALIQFFGMGKGLRLYAVLLGFCAMFFGESAIAVQAPDIWSTAFSPAYMAELAAQSPLGKVAL